MQLIPVIDLKDGQVVHAVRGDRNSYQPIHQHSTLVSSSRIEDVITSFLNLYPFQIIYIADLNAITGSGNHHQTIASLLAQHANIQFWIDNGSQLSDLGTLSAANYKTIIGTESQQTVPDHGNRNFILSLDYKQEQASGHSSWFNNSALWPQHIIVMTLSRVGSNQGPDFEKLATLSNTYPGKTWIAAGGIRNAEDLAQLATMGIDAALIATALHQGQISSQEIIKLQTKKYPGKPGYF